MLQNWIENIMQWRKATTAIKTHKPFVLGPVLHNCYFLLGETGELFNAVFNHAHGVEYHRNPESDRGAVVDELGDCLLMLGTVAGQTDRTQLREMSFAFHDSPVKVARYTISVAHDLCADAEHNDMASNFTTVKMDRCYSLLLVLANTLQIDPHQALQNTFRKMADRVAKT